MPTKKTETSKSTRAKGGSAQKTAKATPGKKTAATPKQAAARVAKTAAPVRPVPERVPGRKERRGVVVSDAMDKTIVVRVDLVQKHSVYGKVVRRSNKLHVHDEHNQAGIGDLVRVVESRPLSATKCWRLLEVLERAK